MKMPLILAAVALMAAGCNPEKQAANDQSRDQRKDSIQKSAREAKAEIEKEARARKQMLDAEARSAQAKLDAEKARAKAESVDAQSKVDAATQSIRDAAGTAAERTQVEIGTAKSQQSPAAPTPTKPAETAATGSDQQLADQVRTAIQGGVAEATDASKDVQVSAAGGVVTLKGTVKSEEDKSRLESVAKSVPGVTSVENQLEVKSP
jgi:osmotically-inducible protein OsmY